MNMPHRSMAHRPFLLSTADRWELDHLRIRPHLRGARMEIWAVDKACLRVSVCEEELAEAVRKVCGRVRYAKWRDPAGYWDVAKLRTPPSTSFEAYEPLKCAATVAAVQQHHKVFVPAIRWLASRMRYYRRHGYGSASVVELVRADVSGAIPDLDRSALKWMAGGRSGFGYWPLPPAEQTMWALRVEKVACLPSEVHGYARAGFRTYLAQVWSVMAEKLPP